MSLLSHCERKISGASKPINGSVTPAGERIVSPSMTMNADEMPDRRGR
jgi:hypothetical protein